MIEPSLLSRLQAGGLYSQATNFASHLVNAGVDARTGQFTLSITLPGLQGNHLAGPLVAPALHFSPLASHLDFGFGFGFGWQLAVSLLDLQHDSLTLSNGESYRLDRRASNFTKDGLLVFSDQKIPAFRVRQLDDAGSRFRIEHKYGESEYLKLQPDYVTALADELATREGFRAFMDWQQVNGINYLQAIRDEQRTLLQVTYGARTVFTVHPGTPQAAAFVFSLINNRLTSLQLPEEDSCWTFGYLDHEGLLFPEEVTNPLGAVDKAHYDTDRNGHRLPPGAPLDWLPRVVEHRHAPGASQPEVVHTWMWHGSSNFLGGDVAPPGGWQDGTDNLYRYPDYTYSCTEALLNAEGAPLATTTYTWNRLHLLTDEVEHLGDKVIRRHTVYGERPGISWEDQPSYCQLPVRVIYRLEDSGRVREEQTETDYDAEANVLATRSFHTGVDGRRTQGPSETFTYLPGDEGDWMCWRASSTLIPAEPAAGAAVIQTTLSYASLPIRRPGDRVHRVAIRELAETLGVGAAPLGETTQDWETDPAAPFFGRPKASHTTMNGLTTTTTWQRTLTQGRIREVEVQTGHDGTTVSTIIERDALTGLTLAEQGDSGSSITYTYDVLGRVLSQTNSTGSAYAVTATNRYSTAGAARDRAVQVEETDITGQVRRLTLDGDGRVVVEAVRDSDITGSEFRNIWTGMYDMQGGLMAETHYDWLPDSDAPLTTTVRRTRDVWGQIRTEHQADGTVAHTVHDPLLHTVRSWQEDKDGLTGGEALTRRAPGGEVEYAALRWPDGRLLREEHWTLDGLNRPLSHKVEADGLLTESQTRYDVFGRVVAIIHTDGSQVGWSYAKHSDGNHPVTVTLTPPAGAPLQLGQCTYDGLGRLLTQQSGDQTETLKYQTGQWPPTHRQGSDGLSTAFRYEPRLSYALQAIQPAAGGGQTYTYSAPLGQLQRVDGGLGHLTMDYTAAGRLAATHWHVNNQTDTISYRTSLRGKPVQVTGPVGVTEVHTYDALGRPATLQHGGATQATTVTFGYDAAGRPATTDTVVADQGPTLSQSQTYDAFGRELTRNWRCRGSDGRPVLLVQALTWTGRDQVASRSLTRDGVLLSRETYQYDRRGRLALIDTEGTSAPNDPWSGKQIARQVFTLTALDSPAQVVFTYTDTTQGTLTYRYDPAVPDRPVQLNYQGGVNTEVTLEWDANGRLHRELWDGVLHRTLEWNSQGQLAREIQSKSTVGWQYDPLGRAGSCETEAGADRRYHHGETLAVLRTPDGAVTAWVRADRTVFAENRLSAAVKTVLLTGTDGQGSVRAEVDTGSRATGYTAYGADDGQVQAQAWTGFAGEVRDRTNGGYHPGGYRPYDPRLMLFLAPDSDSPFGAGGLSRYAYCGGDPVNNIDPTGHSLWKWVQLGLLLVIGIALTVTGVGALAGAAIVAGGAVAVGGAALTMTGTLVAGAAMAMAGTAAGVTAIAGLALEAVSMSTGVAEAILEQTGDEKAAGILGFVSLGAGGAGAASGLAVGGVKAASKIHRLVGRWRSQLKNAWLGYDSSLGPTFIPVSRDIYDSERALKGFHSVSNMNNSNVWLSEYVVQGQHFKGIAENAINNNRNLNIISGTHGTLDGIRAPTNLHKPFYTTDEKIVSTLLANNPNYTAQAKAHDVGMLKPKEVRKILKSADSEIIVGFCYSRNDLLVRETLRLPASVSYVIQ